MLSPDATVDYRKFLQWKSFGLHLGLTIADVSNTGYEENYHHTHIHNYVSRMIMEKWLQNYYKHVEGNTNFPTYSRVKNALKKAGLNEEIRNLIAYDMLPN